MSGEGAAEPGGPPEGEAVAAAGRPEAALRLEAALRAELGSRRIRVEPDGPEAEIAVLRVPPDLIPRLLEPARRARVVARARAEGFRYAALDLALEAGPEDPLAGRGGDLA